MLWCKCEELPRGSIGCALHQAVPFRSWMRMQGEIPTIGSNDCFLMPNTSTESSFEVLWYKRWRRKVWMPSRFYLEQAQDERALQEEEDFSRDLQTRLSI
ncbi:hypothetical protein BRADI_3g37662v3 [Brachypodium distachyon]|uniref:Uncharacterized protein n=1 Tax=Brachypodium distachyon TaxID=15368 RepID=A0A2K2D1S2_BRADI|nr:hypothetical protein BRADI_3g37662v3 [Brachypodium distachyon]